MNTEYRDFFNDIRCKLLAGIITYDQAVLLSKDKIDELNKIGKDIAKKHGKKFAPFTFSYLMR